MKQQPLAYLNNQQLKTRLHPGQTQAKKSTARFILVLAGTQSGKTSYTPIWLLREMIERGPGDYLVVGPTLQLLDKKSIPEFQKIFCRMLKLGTYHANPGHVLNIHARGSQYLFGKDHDPLTPTRILFGYATDPETLESATVKAAVLDEAGQKKFKIGAWQAVQRRLAYHSGRALITTSLYSWNWLKTLADQAAAGDPDYALIRFDSTKNPDYPRAEFQRAQRELPSWLFNMMYRGMFARPAGLIYDCLDDQNLRARTALPTKWKRYIGLDFGPVNTAAVIIAEEPRTHLLIIEHTYKPGRRTVREHINALKRLCPKPVKVIGGSWSEDEWRSDFAHAGLAVSRPPIQDVEVGIQRVYAHFKNQKLHLFDDLAELRDELQTYGRVLDAQGQPTDQIEDKQDYHLLDALRVLIAHLAATPPARSTSAPGPLIYRNPYRF